MNFFTENLAQSLLVVGLILLVIEVAVLGFTTFFLFFAGVGAVLTSVLLYMGIIPDTLLSALLSTGVLTLIAALVLWRPLKSMQANVSVKKAQGDLVGHQFILKDKVSPTESPTHSYSGVQWHLVSDDVIEAGTRVEVIEAQVGIFHIRAMD
ncbi:NfeD family protein [Marinomonas sp. TW1]|uniref:NfeD family protein n=1 Tax=Marinomonas sp. TW1 TaxID=1561203 RepID=UPI0007AF5B8B|nr:NfeD family protein [Marinomonas sp. TW1]KZN13319.1 activity regulator of membrane protease YbbK [Marinomonas sp. TW1]